MKKRFPPFCVYLYNRHYYDFPFCSPEFETESEALHWAAVNKGDYNLVRLGYWTAASSPGKYFRLDDVDVQCSLF